MKPRFIPFIGLLVALLIFVSSCTITGRAVQSSDSCFGLKGSARDNCYFEQGKCSLVKNREFRDSCVAELAKAKSDPAVCNLITSGRTQGYCLELLAIQTRNHGLCLNITDDYWRDNCNFNLGISDKKQEYCELIGNDEQRVDCFKSVALATNNYVLCEKLVDTDRRSCLTTIAVSQRDIALCKGIGTTLENDVCRYKVAKESGNRVFCDAVELRSVREECYTAFKAPK